MESALKQVVMPEGYSLTMKDAECIMRVLGPEYSFFYVPMNVSPAKLSSYLDYLLEAPRTILWIDGPPLFLAKLAALIGWAERDARAGKDFAVLNIKYECDGEWFVQRV